MYDDKRQDGTYAGFLGRRVGDWNRFWFNPADPASLCLIRLCCGLLVLYTHLAYSYDLQAFFGRNAWIDTQMMNKFRKEIPTAAPVTGWDLPSDPPSPSDEDIAFKAEWGMYPSQAAAKGHNLWSIWFHVTDPTGMWIIHGSILVIMLFFAIGFCTRVTGVLTWIAMLSYIQRARTSLFGVDAMMALAVTYLNIGPSGAVLSVDRLIHRYWATRQARLRHERPPDFDRPEPSVSANLAIRLMQINICIIYLISGLTKLQGSAWWNGNAVWLTMAHNEMSPLTNRLYWAFLRVVSAHRWMWELVVMGGTYFTLFFEVSFTFLIWNRRLRWFMIVAAVLMHLGIAICMGLVTFSMMMLCLVLSQVPPQTVREFLAWLRRGASGLQQTLREGERNGAKALGDRARPVRV